MEPYQRILYAGLDLALAALYAFLFFRLIPSRSLAFSLAAGGFVAITVLGGVGIAAGGKWGRRLGVASAWLRLAGCLLFIGLLVSSAAYLHGIYGAVGSLGAALSLVVAALSI